MRKIFDVPPLPNGELVLLVLPNMPPPVLLLEPPKMLPPVFVLEPKPEDAEGKLDMFKLRGATLANRTVVGTDPEGAWSLMEREKRVLTCTIAIAVVVVRPEATKGRRIIVGAEAPKASARPKRHVGLSEIGARGLSDRSDVRARQASVASRVRARARCGNR